MLILRKWDDYTLTHYNGHGYFLSHLGEGVLKTWTDVAEEDAIAMFENFVVGRELDKDKAFL